jgi:phosphate-selective porin OprO and OprP
MTSHLRTHIFYLAFWATTFLLATPLPGAAQDTTPAGQNSTDAGQIRAAEPLRGQAQTAKPGKGKDKDKDGAEQIFRWDDHPSLHFGKGTRIDFRAKLAGELRDSEAPLDDDDVTDALDIARRRVGVAGEIRNLVDFQVEAEIGSDEVWRDVYANYRQFDFVQVQGGKFKLPFSLDENTSSTNLDFVHRSRAASQLAPGRDVGVMVHGRVLKRIFGYELGVFDHDGDNARTVDTDRVYGGQTLAGRATLQPFRGGNPLMSDLQFGAAFTRSDLEEGLPDLRGRTALDLRFFRADAWVRGERQRRGFEFRWRPGPFSIKAEWMRVTDERLELSVEDTDLSPLVGKGWYVSGTWAVTGEKKADGLESPRRPLFRGGYGAVELAARIERLEFGSQANDETPSRGPRANVILGNSDRVETFGVNWYVNRWVKVQFNMVRDTLADPDQGPLPSRSSFWSRLFRFQLSI